MKPDFSLLFEIIRNKFIEGQSGKSITMKAFAQFLGHEHDGKVNAWKKGQWPSAEDIAILHDKLGFNYRWLLTGEGEPLDKEKSSPSSEEIASILNENRRLKEELAEADRVNRKLVARLLIEGQTDEKSAAATGAAAGHE